jgi:hypothetical protein
MPDVPLAILVCSAGILRRDCLVRLGGFDPELCLREDVDFYSRSMRHFGVFFLDQVGLRYRIGSPSLMHSPKLSESDLQHLARRNYGRIRDISGSGVLLNFMYSSYLLAPFLRYYDS